MAHAFVDQFIASYNVPPKVIVLDMDHSEDATHGHREFAFYQHHYLSAYTTQSANKKGLGEIP